MDERRAMNRSMFWRVLRRYDCSRAQRQPRPAPNRYEYAAVGELVHLDIKKLGRFWRVGKRILNDGKHHSDGAGWSYAHVAVDDRQPLAIHVHRPVRVVERLRDLADHVASLAERHRRVFRGPLGRPQTARRPDRGQGNHHPREVW